MALFSKKQSDSPRRRQAMAEQRATPQELTDKYAFRRNRTLTGSSSSQIASANESNAQMKSSRVHTHDLAQKRRQIGGALFLVLIIMAALYALLSQFTASVGVRTNDVTVKLDSSYEQAIQSYFGTQPIERLRFLLNVDNLTRYVQATAPEVKSIEVTGSNGVGKTNITLVMRQPVAGWNVAGSQQYVDSTGSAFKKNYYPAPTVQIIDSSGVPVTDGQAVASNRFLGFVGRLVGLAKEKGYTAEQVIIPRGTTRQVELRIAGTPYPLKFSIDRPAGEQVEDMARTLGYLQQRGITPEYVDLRVANKAFYK